MPGRHGRTCGSFNSPRGKVWPVHSAELYTRLVYSGRAIQVFSKHPRFGGEKCVDDFANAQVGGLRVPTGEVDTLFGRHSGQKSPLWGSPTVLTSPLAGQTSQNHRHTFSLSHLNTRRTSSNQPFRIHMVILTERATTSSRSCSSQPCIAQATECRSSAKSNGIEPTTGMRTRPASPPTHTRKLHTVSLEAEFRPKSHSENTLRG